MRPILLDGRDSVLDLPPNKQITEIHLQIPFDPKEALNHKLSVLDIKARDLSGRLFNIEMQMLLFRAYQKRVLYYWAKLYAHQLGEGERYHELRPTISIS